MVFKTFSADKSTEKIRSEPKVNLVYVAANDKKKEPSHFTVCTISVFLDLTLCSQGLGIQSQLPYSSSIVASVRCFLKKCTLLENKVHFKRYRPLHNRLKSTWAKGRKKLKAVMLLFTRMV